MIECDILWGYGPSYVFPAGQDHNPMIYAPELRHCHYVIIR